MSKDIPGANSAQTTFNSRVSKAAKVMKISEEEFLKILDHMQIKGTDEDCILVLNNTPESGIFLSSIDEIGKAEGKTNLLASIGHVRADVAWKIMSGRTGESNKFLPPASETARVERGAARFHAPRG